MPLLPADFVERGELLAALNAAAGGYHPGLRPPELG
jgi:hypothetical protein